MIAKSADRLSERTENKPDTSLLSQKSMESTKNKQFSLSKRERKSNEKSAAKKESDQKRNLPRYVDLKTPFDIPNPKFSSPSSIASNVNDSDFEEGEKPKDDQPIAPDDQDEYRWRLKLKGKYYDR